MTLLDRFKSVALVGWLLLAATLLMLLVLHHRRAKRAAYRAHDELADRAILAEAESAANARARQAHLGRAAVHSMEARMIRERLVKQAQQLRVLGQPTLAQIVERWNA